MFVCHVKNLIKVFRHDFLLMPRKSIKTEKPPLLFLERPVGGARFKNGPEVRAAHNPKGFFSETQAHKSFNSWVSPQFDSSVAAVLPVRRGRRKCHSATSILDGCSQLSRKNSVCKFPSLTFETRSRRDQPNQPKHTRRRKAAESAVVPDAGNQPLGSCQITSGVSSAQCLDTPKRQSASIRKRSAETYSDGAASSSRCLGECPPIQVTEKCRIRAEGASTPASKEFSSADVSTEVFLPPDVDTPKAIQEESSCPSSPSPSLHWLLARPCTPPHNQPPDILVADTPERDYGVKVTWRRRRGLMLLSIERGHLSNSAALIPS